MKIEFELKDIRFINNINKEIAIGNTVPLFVDKLDRKFNLSFTCTDVAKANAFLTSFMIDIPRKKLEEEFGIRLDSLDYSINNSELKKRLQSIIDEL